MNKENISGQTLCLTYRRRIRSRLMCSRSSGRFVKAQKSSLSMFPDNCIALYVSIPGSAVEYRFSTDPPEKSGASTLRGFSPSQTRRGPASNDLSKGECFAAGSPFLNAGACMEDACSWTSQQTLLYRHFYRH